MREHSDACLNSTQTDNLRINTLIEDFERAFNLSETLGPDVIDGCSVLLRHQEEVVRRLSGDYRCSFAKHETQQRGWKKCVDEAVEQREFRLQLLPIVSNSIKE